MWFKQAKIFHLSASIPYNPEKLERQLESFVFQPCLPSFPLSYGWVSPIDNLDDAPLVHAANGYMLICMQVEEKVLPTVVVRQELNERIKQIEYTQDRTVSQREKYALKDDIIHTLLLRAFSKYSRIYVYIDTKNDLLVLNVTAPSKTEILTDLFKNSLAGMNLQVVRIKKITSILTRWLSKDNYPKTFLIEKCCVLRDPSNQSRIIRCQQQDLSASAIQSLLKDGCEVCIFQRYSHSNSNNTRTPIPITLAR